MSDIPEVFKALQGKTFEGLQREYDGLRQLHAQVVLQYRQAKARGDAAEAEQLRGWVGDLVAQWVLVHVKIPMPEPESDEETRKRLAHMTRDEKIALCLQLVNNEEAAKLMAQALDRLKRGDHDEWKRLTIRACDLLGVPADLYGLE